MATFLNTTKTNYYLEELIKNAQERLVLISPYLQLNSRIKELIEDKNRLKVDIRIVFGKQDLKPDVKQWLDNLDYVRVSYCKNMHAKCYLSERECIITSLNLYEFSQVNNNEMGVHLTPEKDRACFDDAYQEAIRLIRISKDATCNKSAARARSSKSNNGQASSKAHAVHPRPKAKKTHTTPNQGKVKKVPTYKLAKQLDISYQQLLGKLVEMGYLHHCANNRAHSLTAFGQSVGGEVRQNKERTTYFLWPTNLARLA
ncbi:hypothetical protein RJ45_05650 [Photobacterium gaetbulicola]|uniref:Phospholipase D-like domain-containing protein n=1 Tax=Photobacterium gaetbulicola TaxID=1295392 RepID=A0A0B9GIF4_9GAMM|nr:phospholipase D family protein [Photobacterium gaetbulicola]KHT64575.1 hypothetical protein RJ45_05650 [Photobacterium gaetbulicola]